MKKKNTTVLIIVILITMTATQVLAMDVGSSPTSPVTSVVGVPQNFNVCVLAELVSVDWYVNGTFVKSDVGVECSSYANTTSSIGTWLVKANITGTSVVSVYWVWIVNPPPDTTPPSVTPNTNNVRVKNGTTVTPNASISDTSSGVKNATVNVSKINSTLNEVALTNQSGFWLISIIADKATNAAENLQIVAYDNSGNRNDSVGMTVWVDGVAPVINNVTLNTTTPTAGQLILVTVNATDNAGVSGVTANGTALTSIGGDLWQGSITAVEGNQSVNVSVTDSVGNVAWDNWTNYSATTAPEPTPTSTSAPSSGGGGTGGGGGGVVSSEPAANIERFKRVDGSLIANTPVTFSINLPESPVSEIDVTGNENQNDVTLRVDVLKGMAKGVTTPPGVPYRHLIITENSKRIKQLIIRFKVENSWLADNNFAASDIRMLHWDKKWDTLETVVKNMDDKFTFFEAKTDSVSPFTIVGVKPAEATVTAATTSAPTATPLETPAAAETPAPLQAEAEFPLGISLAMMGVIVLAGLFWKPALTWLSRGKIF